MRLEFERMQDAEQIWRRMRMIHRPIVASRDRSYPRSGSLTSFLLVLIAAPIVARHRDNRNLEGFIKGAYGAAIGIILGACVLLGRIAIGNWLTLLIGLAPLAVLIRWKVSNPSLFAVAAVVDLVAFPILQPITL
jgi:chromate transport protein ChrA